MKGLELNSFGDVFTVISDANTKIKSSMYLHSGKYAVVDQGKDLIAGYTDSSPTVTESSLPVIVFGDHTRAVKYVDFPFTAGADGTQILKTSALANPKYAYYLVLNMVAQIPPKGYARHFGELKKMLFPLPALEKQIEIVKKLDLAFDEIDLLERNLAFHDEKTKLLLDSILSGTFAQSRIKPELGKASVNQGTDIKFAPLGDICEISTGSTDTKDATENGQYPLFDRSKKVKASDKYLFDCEALIMPGEGAEFLPRHYVGKFDLHQRAYAMFNFSELVDPKYLYFYLISVKDYFANNAVGATVKSLRRRHFTDLEVPLPAIDKQRAIVDKLDYAFAEIENVKNLIAIKKDFSRMLRKSLLSDSFSPSEAKDSA